MKMDMKKPCKDCPFIAGSSTNRSLEPERLKEIKHAILKEGASFTCHKTLQLAEHDQQHCAGAMMYLEQRNRPNQWMRIMERLGFYNKDLLQQDYSEMDIRDPEEHVTGENEE